MSREVGRIGWRRAGVQVDRRDNVRVWRVLHPLRPPRAGRRHDPDQPRYGFMLIPACLHRPCERGLARGASRFRALTADNRPLMAAPLVQLRGGTLPHTVATIGSGASRTCIMSRLKTLAFFLFIAATIAGVYYLCTPGPLNRSLPTRCRPSGCPISRESARGLPRNGAGDYSVIDEFSPLSRP